MPKLLRDREYLPELFKALARARRSIEVSVFLIDPGDSPNGPVRKIFDRLHRAKRRGVGVTLRTSAIFRAKPSGQRLAALAKRLGLSIEWISPRQFLHEKSVTIDGRLHLIGSHNWSAASLLENRELTVRVDGTAFILSATDFRRELLRALPLAQKEITIATYDITDIASTDSDFADLVARQLIFARMKKRKVRLILDASPTRAAGGKDLILYRGRAKAAELARQGVHVWYDTTDRLFHAKVAILDGEDVFIGSQNVYPARDGEIEKTVHIKSKRIADEIKTYLADVLRTAARFHYDPLAVKGVRIPAAWVQRGGPIAKIFRRKGTKTFKLLLALLHERERLKNAEIPWDVDRLATLAGFRVPRRFTKSVKNREHYLQRLLTQPRLFLRRDGVVRYHAKPMIALETVELVTPLTLPADFFILPFECWTYGWISRLTPAEIYNYLIHLSEVVRSPEAPVWSLRARDVPKSYGITFQRFCKNTVKLERWNLIEVARDPKIVVPNVPKKANRYRVNALWSMEEFETALKKLKEEFMASDQVLAAARRFSARLNQPYDIDVIRKFLTLIEQYSSAKVTKAIRITARFAHNFALRNVHHTAGILKNWANPERSGRTFMNETLGLRLKKIRRKDFR